VGRGIFFCPVCHHVSVLEVLNEARPVLLRLALTSQVGAGQVVPQSSGTTVHSSSRPSGTPQSPAERYADLIMAAGSEREARRHLEAARLELQAVLRRPLAVTTAHSARELASRIVSEGVGMSAVDVAMVCRCTPSLVRASRIAADREPERGRSLAGVTRERWASELRAAGYSLRAVSAMTGIPRSTLHSRERSL